MPFFIGARESAIQISQTSEKDGKTSSIAETTAQSNRKDMLDMKHMNNHYGQSLIFTRARFRVMDLGGQQFFAPDGGGAGGAGGAGDNGASADSPGTQTGDGLETDKYGLDGNQTSDEEAELKYDDLVAQLAKAQAEREKYKNLSDKYSREAAESKKLLRTKLTAQEQQDIEKRQAEEAKDNRIKELEEQMAIIDNTSFWGGTTIGMDEKLARSTAEAEAKGDKESFRQNIAKHIKAIRVEEQQKFYNSRPDIAAGSGDDGKNSLGNSLAKESAKKVGGVNIDILKHYRGY